MKVVISFGPQHPPEYATPNLDDAYVRTVFDVCQLVDNARESADMTEMVL